MATPTRIGRYDLQGRIGRGGMGVVYRAHDPQINRTVAIKILQPIDEDQRPPFLREIRVLGTLKHRNIVTIYDCGEDDGQPFIVMEFVDGMTLADYVFRGAAPLSRNSSAV